MKAMRSHIVGGGLICLLILLTSTAGARVYVSVGLGTSFGHYYPHYYGHHYPYYRWYGGYRSYYRPWYGHSYYPGYYRSPRSSFWVSGYYPIVINRKSAARKTEAANPPKHAELSQSVRQHKSEQLKVLRIGTKENRQRAIRELARFPTDPKVREALERVLLSDPDPELRKQVATLFGATENAKTVAALKTAKAIDPDRDVRQAAYRAIIMIEGY